jgi:glycosyltransferase involved in cell wall biosynthesis
MLTVVSVAYPLAPVRPDTSGGAEQVLGMLDAALGRAGHRSIVIAAHGSRVAGALVATEIPEKPWNDERVLKAREGHRAAIRQVLERVRADVVHMHGQDFQAYLPPPGVPVLVTLHVPREWYGPVEIARPNTFLHCVSEAQRRTWPEGFPMLPPIENGVDADRFATHVRKREFALALGRISPEKGTHVALRAAELAGVQLVIAGKVYRYEEHERYFREQVVPRLQGSSARLIGPVGFERKRRLLTAARCVLLPSQVAETSSLVAMEALACGTAVIAYPAGALADIVEHGKTGYLVTSAGEMAIAIRAADGLDPAACRAAARERFPAARTIEEYFRVYTELARVPARAAS